MNKTKKHQTEATQNTLREEEEELLWRKKKLAENDGEDSLEDEF